MGFESVGCRNLLLLQICTARGLGMQFRTTAGKLGKEKRKKIQIGKQLHETFPVITNRVPRALARERARSNNSERLEQGLNVPSFLGRCFAFMDGGASSDGWRKPRRFTDVLASVR